MPCTLGHRNLRVLAAIALVTALAAPALAEDVVTYRSQGSAPLPAGGDEKQARTLALDEAFKAATRQALGELAAPDALVEKAAEIDAEVTRRARLWVASFKVARQQQPAGTLVLEVDVRIDREKLRARLLELGVAIGGGDPDAGDAPPRSATLLLRVSTIEGALATYGAGASSRVPGVDEAESALRRRGLALVPAPASGPAAKPGDGLPLSDEAARALAGDVRANLVVIAGVDQAAPGPVRGTRSVAGLARAHVKLVDASNGAVLGQGRAARGAIGQGAAQVAEAASVAALLEAIAVAAPRRDPAPDAPALDLALPAAREGEVVVRIRGATGAQAAAIQDHLASAQGVKSARLRRLAGGEVVLAVRGVRADRVAALVRGVADVGANARVEGGAVEVRVR